MESSAPKEPAVNQHQPSKSSGMLTSDAKVPCMQPLVGARGRGRQKQQNERDRQDRDVDEDTFQGAGEEAQGRAAAHRVLLVPASSSGGHETLPAGFGGGESREHGYRMCDARCYCCLREIERGPNIQTAIGTGDQSVERARLARGPTTRLFGKVMSMSARVREAAPPREST